MAFYLRVHGKSREFCRNRGEAKSLHGSRATQGQVRPAAEAWPIQKVFDDHVDSRLRGPKRKSPPMPVGIIDSPGIEGDSWCLDEGRSPRRCRRHEALHRVIRCFP